LKVEGGSVNGSYHIDYNLTDSKPHSLTGKEKTYLFQHNVSEKVNKLLLLKERELIETTRNDYQSILRKERSKFYAYAFEVAESRYFRWIVNLSVIANTVLQSFDQYPEPSYIKELDYINSFFSAVFIIEMFVKIAAHGFRQFFKDSFHFFDGMVVFFSTVDLVISNLFVDINVDAITALRAFRILRIFKLSKTWK
jgi:Ion transport protein